MPNFAMRSMILAACLTTAACTADQASAPDSSPAESEGSAVADSKVVVPAAKLTLRTAALDGLDESPLCALDSVNGMSASEGTFAVSANQPITFEGWVAMSNMQSPGTFKIILDGQSDFEISSVTGVFRKDVADAYSAAALETAGYKAALPALEVPADTYVVMIGHDEAAAVVCKTNLSLVVTQ